MSIEFVDDIGKWIEQRYGGGGIGAVYHPAAGAGTFVANAAAGFDLLIVDPPFNRDMVTMDVVCRVCKRPQELTVSRTGWERKCGGEAVQNALPELSRSDRELLISGTCGACYANMLEGWGFESADAGEE